MKRKNPGYEGSFFDMLAQPEYTIFDRNGSKIRVWDSGNYGLQIEQTFPSGKKVHMSYGNDQTGHHLYIQLLKFLIATGKKIPKYPTSKKEVELSSVKGFRKILTEQIKSWCNYEILTHYPTPHQMDMDSTGVVSPYQKGTQRGLILELQGKSERVVFSAKTIESLARAIPLLYPRSAEFHVIHDYMVNPSTMRMVKHLSFRRIQPEIIPKRMKAEKTRESMKQARKRLNLGRRI